MRQNNLDTRRGKMFILGITGGIGAGKSTVSGILKDLGAKVIDADRISKQVVEPFKPAWHEIVKIFGEEIIGSDHSIERKKLADIVFQSEQKRLLLESIIHAEVVKEMGTQLELLKSQGYDGIVVLDVPIPVKHGFLDTVDRVWTVVCNDEERIRRIMKRGGLTRKEAENRINAQLSQEEYMRLAHEVIVNDSSEEDLRKKVTELYYKILG